MHGGMVATDDQFLTLIVLQMQGFSAVKVPQENKS